MGLSDRKWVGKQVYWNVYNHNGQSYEVKSGLVVDEIDGYGQYTVQDVEGVQRRMPWHVLFATKLSAVTNALIFNLNPPDGYNSDKIVKEALHELKHLAMVADSNV